MFGLGVDLVELSFGTERSLRWPSMLSTAGVMVQAVMLSTAEAENCTAEVMRP